MLAQFGSKKHSFSFVECQVYIVSLSLIPLSLIPSFNAGFHFFWYEEAGILFALPLVK